LCQVRICVTHAEFGVSPSSVFPLSGISISASAIEIRKQRLKTLQMFNNDQSLGNDRLHASAV
jgi:hypothetical protein